MATLRVPEVVPSPTQDSERLRQAVRGYGTDEEAIIWILGHRDASQRREIRDTYKQLYDKSLVDRLHSELFGDFRKAVLLWTYDPAERDARLANEALKTRKKRIKQLPVIVEIACASTPRHLQAVRQAYCFIFDCSLEEDIASSVSPPLRKLLVGLVKSYRYDKELVDIDVANSEAAKLREALKMKQLFHDDVVYILGTRNLYQLRATFKFYKHKYGIPIEQEVRGCGNGQMESMLIKVISCIDSPEKHFAEVIRASIIGLGTDEDSLTRAIVTRAEIDLIKIREEYSNMFQSSLDDAVIGNTSGDYRHFLTTLLEKFSRGRYREREMATLTLPGVVTSPTQDSERLRQAVKGYRTDKKAIIWILGHRNASQKRKIRDTYQQLYDESLTDRLHSELSGDFRKAVLLWTYDPPERDARLANKALKSRKKRIKQHQVIVDIACASTPHHLQAVRQAYCSIFDCSLEEDIASYVFPPLRKLLVGLVKSYRYDKELVDNDVANSEAANLREALKMKQLFHDDVLYILCTRNLYQLRATFKFYEEKYGIPIDQEVRGCGNGQMECMLIMVISCIDSPEKHFAEVIGNGTDEDSLTRAIVTRAEVDLMKIRGEYFNMFQSSLEDTVIGHTSGDHKHFLMTLLGRTI